MPQVVGVLHVIGGNDRGKLHELSRPETRIGRGTDQDLVLADIAVSRRHVNILTEGQRYRLKDLGSGNGSLVNGQRVDSVILNDGDQIEIGNTLMRFDHAPSRAAASRNYVSMPPNAAPPVSPHMAGPGPGQASPAPVSASAVMVPPASAGYAPPAMAYGAPPAAPGFTPSSPPSGNFANGQPPTPSGVGNPALAVAPPVRVASGRPILDSPAKRFTVFGGMGLVILLCLTAIISRKVFARPMVVPSEAEEVYRQGLRLFAAGDYEGARGKFTAAGTQVPDSPEVKRYARLCDVELKARSSLKNAERALLSRRYVEAIRALEGVENVSVLYDQASRLKRENAPKAASEAIDEARRLAQEDPDGARARVLQALELDPGNPDARELQVRLRVGSPIPPPSSLPSIPSAGPISPVSPISPGGSVAPPPSFAPERTPREREPKRAASRAPRERAKPKAPEDEDFAEVKVGKPAREPATPVAAPDSKSGMAMYRNRDFAGAVKTMRLEAMSQPAKQAQKSIDFANQVQNLKQIVNRAAGDEARNPGQAAKDYEEALQLDGRLSRGIHAQYFRGKIGKLELQAAQGAMQAGKYDAAYGAVQTAQKLGVGDGGMLRQLEAKAVELVQKGQQAQKTNVPQAKAYWRMVIKMVPSSSPSYVKAYALLNNATAARRDEDED